MTVKELVDALEDYGDHLEIKVVKDGKQQDTFFTPVHVGSREQPGGEIVIQIEIDQAD